MAEVVTNKALAWNEQWCVYSHCCKINLVVIL